MAQTSPMFVFVSYYRFLFICYLCSLFLFVFVLNTFLFFCVDFSLPLCVCFVYCYFFLPLFVFWLFAFVISEYVLVFSRISYFVEVVFFLNFLISIFCKSFNRKPVYTRQKLYSRLVRFNGSYLYMKMMRHV